MGTDTIVDATIVDATIIAAPSSSMTRPDATKLPVTSDGFWPTA